MSISLVQHKTSNPLAANPTLAFNSNVTAGDLIIVAATYVTSGAITSITDSQGNVYTACGAEASANNSGTFFGKIFRAVAGSSGACTVTINSSASISGMFILEVSGVNSQDQFLSGFGAGTSVDSGGVITLHADEFLFGFYIATGSNSTQNPGSGWTALDVVGVTQAGFDEDQIVAATGTYHTTATLNVGKSGSPSWAAFIVTFFQSGGDPYAPARMFALF